MKARKNGNAREKKKRRGKKKIKRLPVERLKFTRANRFEGGRFSSLGKGRRLNRRNLI